MEAAHPDDAHRSLDKSHDLAASLSHVETRQVRNDYTLRWDGKFYQIDRQAVTPGLRKANVRVEERLDGTLAVRHGARYLPVKECAVADKSPATPSVQPAERRRAGQTKSNWMKNFNLKGKPRFRTATG